MPELPEVEVTRRGFADLIQGAQIRSIGLGKPLRWPLGCSDFELVGQKINRVDRRGKYLIIQLQRGVLLVHLGMSGSLRFAQELPPPGPHDHFTLTTSSGVLRLHDPRRFGAVVYSKGLDQEPASTLLAKLGTEPLSDEFTADKFVQAMQQRRQQIKQVLLSGQPVVGVGNIYACEVLFLAGINPRSKACRVAKHRLHKLHSAIRDVLGRAVEQGGSSLRDFAAVDGEHGTFLNKAQVYGREGLPCRACATPVRKVSQGQRSSYFCPNCQRG